MKHVKIGDFQKRKYLQNLKLLSTFKQEKSSAYVYLVATFLSLSFLVFFAIGPTIGTITELQKKLADSKEADIALSAKIENMNMLGQQYNQISNDLPLIVTALPESPSVTDLLGRIQAAALNNNVEIRSLTSTKIPITNTIPITTEATEPVVTDDPSFVFSLTISGDYNNLLGFFKSIANFDRIVTVTSFSVSREEDVEGNGESRILTIEGKAYYLK